MNRFKKIVEWTFVVFGIICLIASASQLYGDYCELKIPFNKISPDTYLSPAICGVAFLSVGLTMRKKKSV